MEVSMNRKSNKSHVIYRVVALFAMFCTITGLFGNQALAAKVTTAKDIKIGQYITFGTYDKEPILWRVIDIDKEGNPLLYAENILTYKAFDDQLWVANTAKNYGNNYWASSDLRAWLNGVGDEIAYDASGAPKSGTTKDGWNAYEEEQGFLTEFTNEERDAIVLTKHKQLIDEVNSTSSSVVNKDAKLHRYESAMKDCLTNYEEARYLVTEEKVFLLDIKEFYTLIYQAGFPVVKEPTKNAKEKNEAKNKLSFSPYWLRTPRASYAEESADPKYGGISAKPDGASVRVVYGKDYILAKDAYDGSVGVIPALYLDKDCILSEGKGSITSPYRTKGLNEK